MIRNIITAILLAPMFWFAFLFARAYITSTKYTSWWDRFLSAGKDSASIAWAQLVILATTLVNTGGAIAVYMTSDPTLADKIQAALPSQYVAAFVVFIMVVTIFARLRTKIVSE
jgi:hypothetical protein